jgi:uncharacterized protein YecA (UPF0149 family)
MMDQRTRAFLKSGSSNVTMMPSGPAPQKVIGILCDVLPRAVHRAGRNQECPCGSGKKFKRCCGNGYHDPSLAKE